MAMIATPAWPKKFIDRNMSVQIASTWNGSRPITEGFSASIMASSTLRRSRPKQKA